MWVSDQCFLAYCRPGDMTTLAGLSQGYDLAGNQTRAYSADRATSYTYRYDHHNRLTGVYDSTNTTRKAAFVYDALGRRVEFAHDGLAKTTDYYYDGVNEVVETPGADAAASRSRRHASQTATSKTIGAVKPPGR
ncbi:MAG: hypothetical protein U1A27_05785 [Phycisphaerae bacterium]